MHASKYFATALLITFTTLCGCSGSTTPPESIVGDWQLVSITTPDDAGAPIRGVPSRIDVFSAEGSIHLRYPAAIPSPDIELKYERMGASVLQITIGEEQLVTQLSGCGKDCMNVTQDNGEIWRYQLVPTGAFPEPISVLNRDSDEIKVDALIFDPTSTTSRKIDSKQIVGTWEVIWLQPHNSEDMPSQNEPNLRMAFDNKGMVLFGAPSSKTEERLSQPYRITENGDLVIGIGADERTLQAHFNQWDHLVLTEEGSTTGLHRIADNTSFDDHNVQSVLILPVGTNAQ